MSVAYHDPDWTEPTAFDDRITTDNSGQYDEDYWFPEIEYDDNEDLY